MNADFWLLLIMPIGGLAIAAFLHFMAPIGRDKRS